MYPFICTTHSVVVMANQRTYEASSSHANFDRIINAIRNEDWETVIDLFDVSSAVSKYGEGLVEVVDGEVLYNGEPIHNTMVARILDMMYEGFNVQPMVAFLQNLMKNPSNSAINELYDFLEAGKLPITPDGCFIAYRRVGEDWLDLHSDSICNKPASLMSPEEVTMYQEPVNQRDVTVQIVDDLTTISMERNKVDSNRNQTCSFGLHFCSFDYLDHFGSGGHIVAVKINPADVVSIPSDYNNTKGRCCKYQILYELSTDGRLDQPAFDKSVDPGVPEIESGNNTHSAEFIMYYVLGFTDGKTKSDRVLPESEDAQAGWAAGYKDGRGKKKRLYTKEDVV